MKNTKKLGTTLILIGVLILFQKVETHYSCFGGYYDDSLEILLSSILVMVIGLICIKIKTFKTLFTYSQK